MDNPPLDGSFPGEIPLAEPPAPEVSRPEPERKAIPLTKSDLPLRSGAWIHALAGLQAGIVGVIWMLACFVVAAFWNGGGIWSIPNLFSTLFYGENAYQNEFFRATWAGLALIVVLYGLTGVVWGCFWKDHRKPLLSFYGAVTGLATYFFFFDFAWAHLNPVLPLYAPVRQLEVAHLLWGIALAKSPVYSARIAAALRPPKASGGDWQEPGQDAAEIVSGELIR